MRIARIVSLLIIILLCLPGWAAQSNDAKHLPTIKMTEHQKMMIGDKVIYEADVNVLDPDAKHYWIEIGIDEQKWRLSAADRSVAYAGKEGAGASGAHPSGWMVSYVVQDKDGAGMAQVDLIYTIRDPMKGINRTEHVHADLQVGRRFDTTTASGAKVWLLVTHQ